MGLEFDAACELSTTTVSEYSSSERAPECCSTPKRPTTTSGHEELDPKRQAVASMVCPPAPRKPRPAKRKAAGAAAVKDYFPVPSDLAAVFVPLSCLASKKIRVG